MLTNIHSLTCHLNNKMLTVSRINTGYVNVSVDDGAYDEFVLNNVDDDDYDVAKKILALVSVRGTDSEVWDTVHILRKVGGIV